jgi:hypothetical protein
MSHIKNIKAQLKELRSLLVETQSDIDVSIAYLLGPYSYDDDIIETDLPTNHKIEIIKMKQKASYISGKIETLTFVMEMIESDPGGQ